MEESITSRQTQILKLLIDEYINSADPVGSLALEKKYNLGVSPATIRNEMVSLTSLGYLKQPHTSSGRVPTSKAMKFYVNQLMEEERLSLTQEIKAKEDVLDNNNDLNELMTEATRGLAKNTHSLAIAVTNDGQVWHSGYANLFDNPEFHQMDVCAGVFSMIEEIKTIQELFLKRLTGASPIEIMLGEDFNWPAFEPVGVVATRFNTPQAQGSLGIIGPLRLDYPHIVPAVRYFRELIEEASEDTVVV